MAVSLAEDGAAPGAEDRLAGAAERRADAGALAVLQEHDGNYNDEYNHMNDNDDGMHINYII